MFDGAALLFKESGLKDSIVIAKLHDEFWKKRRLEVFSRDKFRCVQCSSPFRIECDHIQNRSQGGTHSMDNLQTLCHNCHYHKTNVLGKWAKKKHA